MSIAEHFFPISSWAIWFAQYDRCCCVPVSTREGRPRARERGKVHWFDRFDITPSGRITVLLLFSCCAGANVSCRGTELSRGRNTKENGGSWENLAKSRETRSIIHPTQDWEDVNICDGSPLVNTQPRRASERERECEFSDVVYGQWEKRKRKKLAGSIEVGPYVPNNNTHKPKKGDQPPEKKGEKNNVALESNEWKGGGYVSSGHDNKRS